MGLRRGMDGDGAPVVVDRFVDPTAHLRLVPLLEGQPGFVGHLGREIHARQDP